MKLSFRIVSIVFMITTNSLQSAELIRKNLEKHILAQELERKNLLSQMADLALPTFDTSEYTPEEIEELKKKLIEAGEKALKGQSAQPTHARHNSI